MSDIIPVPSDFTPAMHRRPVASAKLIPDNQLDKQGYCKGDFLLGRTMSGKPFGINEEANLLTCSGTGGGKGVSTVIPNLLQFPGTTVVVDPKGDLASITAEFRSKVLGQKVIVLDPANVADVPAELKGTYNPFDALDADDPLVITAAQVLASAIVVPNPKASEPFWDHISFDFIQSCILYMVKHYPPGERTLMKLLETVTVGDLNLYEAWLKHKRADDPDFDGSINDAFALLQKAMFDTDDFGGALRQTAAKIGNSEGKLVEGIKATAGTHLDFVKSPELWGVVKSNIDPARTFTLKELRRQDRHITIYICLPVDMIPRQGRWLRIIISQIIQSIERSKFDKSNSYPILMMIDEFFQLGPMPSIVNTLTYARSFGLRLWLILQDLNQLKTNYPDSWETILGACGIKQFFGINDSVTAKYVSELIGDEEIDVPTISLTKVESDTDSVNRSDSITDSETDTEGWNESSTTGTSGSDTTSVATSVALADSYGSNSGTTIGQGQSGGTNNNISEGQNTGTSSSKNYDGSGVKTTSIGSGSSSGSNTGVSSGSQSGWNNNSSTSAGTNHNRTKTVSTTTTNAHTSGWNNSTTVGKSGSKAIGRSTGHTDGWGQSKTNGMNYAISVTKQKRRRFTPDEVMLSFTKSNLVQLIHLRDHGGFLLRRMPYFAELQFQWLLSITDQQKLTAPSIKQEDTAVFDLPATFSVMVHRNDAI